MTYDWRCTCGKENTIQFLHCSACAKQRWAQLGLTAHKARGLRVAILPNSLIKTVDPEMLVAGH